MNTQHYFANLACLLLNCLFMNVSPSSNYTKILTSSLESILKVILEIWEKVTHSITFPSSVLRALNKKYNFRVTRCHLFATEFAIVAVLLNFWGILRRYFWKLWSFITKTRFIDNSVPVSWWIHSLLEGNRGQWHFFLTISYHHIFGHLTITILRVKYDWEIIWFEVATKFATRLSHFDAEFLEESNSYDRNN